MTKEELIAYDKWLTRRKWGTGEIISPEKAADLYLAEQPLPPAEGAEKVQRCPVCMGRGLVPNSFYATTSGIGSTTQTYLPEKCRTCNGAGVIILPYPKLQPTAEGAELDHSLDHQHDHPEGAEEINAEFFNDNFYHRCNGCEEQPAMVSKLLELATLHAQRLAEEMVEERIQDELNKFVDYINNEYCDDNVGNMLDIEDVFNYLKSREK